MTNKKQFIYGLYLAGAFLGVQTLYRAVDLDVNYPLANEHRSIIKKVENLEYDVEKYKVRYFSLKTAKDSLENMITKSENLPELREEMKNYDTAKNKYYCWFIAFAFFASAWGVFGTQYQLNKLRKEK